MNSSGYQDCAAYLLSCEHGNCALLLYINAPGGEYHVRESGLSLQALKDTSILKSEKRNAASLHVDDRAEGSGQHVHLEGNWRSANLHLVLQDFDKLARSNSGDLTLDLSNVTDIDTAGIWLLCRLKKQQEEAGRTVRFEGTNQHIDELIATFSKEPDKQEPEQKEKG